MAQYRFHELLPSESINTAATKTIDINTSKCISKIGIRVKGTNSSSTPTAHPAKMVSKIELVDGSDVLFSMSGVQAQALNFLENGELNFGINEYEDNIQVCATYQLNFGRYIWDELFCLDPNKFTNLQLKITHNKALGGSAPDAGTLAVYMWLFDDKQPAPRGFLMSKEQFNYTLTASATETINMARDYPYRMIIPQSYVDNKGITGNINKVTLSIDNDAEVLLNNISVSEFIKQKYKSANVQEDLATLGTASAVTYYIASTYENYGQGVGRSAHQSASIVGQPSGNQVSLTNDTSESMACRFTGYCAFGGLDVSMWDRDKPEEWLDVAGRKALELKIYSGSGGSGAVGLLTQQFRRY